MSLRADRLESYRSRRVAYLDNSPSNNISESEVSPRASIVTMSAVPATSVNPYYIAIDLTTDAGKKLYNSASTGLPESQQYTGGANTNLHS